MTVKPAPILPLLVALLALTVAPAAHAGTCPRMRLYVVTGNQVEPQFRVYSGRLVTDGVSCRLARSVVRALNRHPMTAEHRVSIRVSGRRWDCLRAPNYDTGYADSRCERAAGRVKWSQSAILD